MMKKVFLFVILNIVGMTVNAQQDDNKASHSIVIVIPELALLSLESATGTSINLKAIAPTEAGGTITFSPADTSLWLNYSSIVGGVVALRNITVQITDGELPKGTVLSLIASADAGEGDGTIGVPSGSINLSSSPQNIITAIGSAYTGKGLTKGHNLSFLLGLDTAEGSYAKLNINANKILVVTYTLSDN